LHLDKQMADRPFPFEFSIVRSARRRTSSIEIRNAEVIVRAPPGIAEKQLLAFLAKKQRWILEKIAEQTRRINTVPVRSYQHGGAFPYLGRLLILQIEQAATANVSLQDDILRVQLSRRSRLSDEEQTRRLVAGWYQQQAITLLTGRTRALASSMGLVARKVSVKVTRSRWGQCTTSGDIQYNWYIVLAPDAIVDYLVAHEVCHLRHHNHSAAFWSLVEQVCPEWRHSRQWLRNQGAHLVL
jgi:predicted metal-dependent hydrolase